MSTYQGNIVWAATNSAQMMAAFSALSAAFDAVGFAKTTDTGQINLASTSLYPAAPAAYTTATIGYEIRSLTKAGLPTLYAKVTYGLSCNGSAADSCTPALTIQWGTATDGAGNLGGVVSPYLQRSLQSYSPSYMPLKPTPSTTARPFYVASDGSNYLTVMIDPTITVKTDTYTNVNGTSTPVALAAFTIERTITPGDGVYNSVGWAQLDVGGNNSVSSGGANSTGYAITSIQSAFTVGTATGIPSQTPGTLFTSSGTGNSCSLFPITVMTPLPQGPMLSAVAYFTNDIVPGVQFQATLYGALHTYFALGQNPCNGYNCNPANSASYSPALRYE